MKYIGIYYHCNDLYFKFPRYTAPEELKAIDLPLHYLTACLLIEIFDVLHELVRGKAITSTKETEVSKSLWRMLVLKRPSLPNADSFEVLISVLTKRVAKT